LPLGSRLLDDWERCDLGKHGSFGRATHFGSETVLAESMNKRKTLSGMTSDRWVVPVLTACTKLRNRPCYKPA